MAIRSIVCAGLVAIASAGSALALTSSELESWKAKFRRPASIEFPKDNPYTPSRELLGRTLFFDPRLSGSGILSCASCHNPSFGWGDSLALGVGHGMVTLDRRTPTILNVGVMPALFWDGRAPSLEAQALGPIEAPVEMNQPLGPLPAKVAAIAGYKPLFERAYPGQGVTLDTIAKAIATFERTIVSASAPFDAWIEGDDAAMPPRAKNGFALFVGRARCADCHTGWAFSDGKFHDIGVITTDLGRAKLHPDEPNALHAFKTPGLRDIGLRAPYMHNGSVPDLRGTVKHYVAGNYVDRPSLSPRMQPIGLTEDEIDDIVAFLATLNAPQRSFPTPRLPR